MKSMASYISLFITTILIFNLIQPGFSYVFNGFSIKDLEKNDPDFAYDAELWTTSSSVIGLQYTVCSGSYLLGGYGVLGALGVPAQNEYFQRIYTTLPTHTMIYFSFTFWAIDTWDYNVEDSFQLQFDSRTLNGWMLDTLNFPMTTSSCGLAGARDLRTIRVFGRVYHSGTSLTFRIISQLDQWPTDESFGFRDLNLLFARTPVTVLESLCGIASISLTSAQCVCPEGQYEYPLGSGTCIDCDSTCSSCFGATGKHCYACASDAYFDGISCYNCYSLCSACTGPGPNQCTACKPGNYRITDGTSTTCVDSCDAPLTKSVVTSVDYCQSTCSGSNFIYWSTNCDPTCPFPLQQKIILNIRQCIYPCATDQYLYWNGSCFSDCNTPFTIRIEGTAKYCDVNCPINQFLYPNGTCLTACNSPLTQTINSGKKLCGTTCTSGELLYNNGSCLTTCEFPLLKREEGGIVYCNYPCSTTEYSAWNGSCVTSCDLPLRVITEPVGDFCKAPCDSLTDYYYEDTQQCHPGCSQLSVVDPKDLFLKCMDSTIQDEGTLISYLLLAPTTPETLSPVSPFKFLQYLRFLDINFPSRVEQLLMSPSRSLFSLRLFPRMNEEIKAKFRMFSIPSIFMSRGLHSSFLVNFWAEFISFLIIVAALITFFCLEKFSKLNAWKSLTVFFERLRVIVGWSFLLIFIAINLGDILFFSVLQMKVIYFGSALDILSAVISAGMIAVAGVFLMKAVDIIPEMFFAKQTAWIRKSNEIYVKKLLYRQNYQILYRGFRNNTLTNQFFFLLYVIRIALPMVIAAYLYAVPLLQIILYILINVFILSYILMKRPLVSKVNHIQLVILEILMLISNILALVLVIFHMTESTNVYGRTFVGDLFILANDSLNLHIFLFFIIKLILGAKAALKLRKARSFQEIGAWFQLIFIFLQQGGMGFERAQVTYFLNFSITLMTKETLRQKEEKTNYEAINQTVMYIDTVYSLINYKDGAKANAKKKKLIPRYDEYTTTIEGEIELFRREYEEDLEEELSEMTPSQTETVIEDISASQSVLNKQSSKNIELSIDVERNNTTMHHLMKEDLTPKKFEYEEEEEPGPPMETKHDVSRQEEEPEEEVEEDDEESEEGDDNILTLEQIMQEDEMKNRRMKRKDEGKRPEPVLNVQFEEKEIEPSEKEVEDREFEQEENDLEESEKEEEEDLDVDNNVEEDYKEEEVEQVPRRIKRNNNNRQEIERKVVVKQQENIEDQDEENEENEELPPNDIESVHSSELPRETLPEFSNDFHLAKSFEGKLRDYASSQKLFRKIVKDPRDEEHMVPEAMRDIIVVNASYNEVNLRKKLKRENLENEENEENEEEDEENKYQDDFENDSEKMNSELEEPAYQESELERENYEGEDDVGTIHTYPVRKFPRKIISQKEIINVPVKPKRKDNTQKHSPIRTTRELDYGKKSVNRYANEKDGDENEFD